MDELLRYAQKIDEYDYPENDPAIKEHLAIDAAYKKIRSYKYYIKGLLNDLNLYKHFEYFYIPKYVVSTGRLQSSPFYLQLQGSKIALPFIHCYLGVDKDLTEEEYTKMKEIFISTNPELKDNELPLDIKSLNRQGKNLYIQQVQELCKSDVKLSEYKDHKHDLVTEFTWLYKSCKKLEYVFYLKSLMDALENGTYKCKIIKKDATGSGPQIISMLTEDDEFMQFTNIVGDTFNDLYKRMIDEYTLNIEKQKEMLEEFCITVFNVTYAEFKEGHNIPQGTKNIIYQLIFMSKSQTKGKGKNSSEFYLYYKEHKASFNNIRPNIEKMIMKVTSPIIDIAEDADSKRRSSDNMLATLFKIRTFRDNIESYDKIPTEMLTRKLFKKWIMAFAYAQGRISRGESIKEDIIDFFLAKGYKNKPLSDHALNLVINNLLDFFYHYSNKYLIPLLTFLNAIQFFIVDSDLDKTKELSVELKYCTWTLRCHEHTETRHSFNVNGKPHKFTLYHKHFHNTKKVGSIVPSIFVQGIEAHIVHDLFFRVIKINKQLKEHNLPLIIISTNQDNFGINVIYAPFFTPLVQQCYNTVSKLTFPILDKHLKKTSFRYYH